MEEWTLFKEKIKNMKLETANDWEEEKFNLVHERLFKEDLYYFIKSIYYIFTILNETKKKK